jgi:CBS domain-containing protein
VSTVAEPPVRVLHLSTILGGALRDRDGERIGRVDDLIVRLGQTGYPPITGFLVAVAGRQSYLPSELVVDMGPGAITVSKPRLDLRRFERRREEVLLKKDVLDHQLINVDGARLVRANDIELARVEGWWRVVGVDTGPRGALRRLLPKRFARKVGSSQFLDWAKVEPFVGHVPSVRLRVPHPKLARLHPAELADLVEAANRSQGEEIIQAVEADRELEADVFEELDEQHQREFLAERSAEEVAAVVTRMQPDDAADVIVELDDERREEVLGAMPPQQRAKVRALLGYDPATAGGLMSPDFLCLYRQATVAEALDRIRRSPVPSELLSSIYLMDSHRRLEGAVNVVELVRADPDTALVEMDAPATPKLVPEADFEEVARLMADYNLISAPVVDDAGRMIGIVTVDDVLEVMLPKGWRRRFGLFGEP